MLKLIWGHSKETTKTLFYTGLRILMGLLLVPHGAQKLFGFFGGDFTKTAEFLAASGYPFATMFAFLIGVLEFFGGIALILGFLTRPIALAVAGFMGFAVLFHLKNGFFWTDGGFEYPLLWGIVALYVAVSGGGKYSVDHILSNNRI